MENYENNVAPFRLDDLQLAAELGKSLLERNMELERQLKACKSKGDDQEREIQHLRKHIGAMSEENDSRMQVYEQLDLMLQELERTNRRLSVEKCRDKDQIKLMITNIEILEARCEQLTQQLNIARQSLNKVDRYRQERHTNSQRPLDQEMGYRQERSSRFEELAYRQERSTNLQLPRDEELGYRFERHTRNSPREEHVGFPEIQPIVLARHDNQTLCHSNLALSLVDDSVPKSDTSDDLIRLLGEMETVMRDFLTERRRCAELEDQMRTVIQENQFLQRRQAESTARQDMMMSVREEVSLLDEVRQGRMCHRCLGNINQSNFNLYPRVQLNKSTQTEESSVPVRKEEYASKIVNELEHKRSPEGRVPKITQRPAIESAAAIKKKNRRKHRQGFEISIGNNPPTLEPDEAPASRRSVSPSSSMGLSGHWNGGGMTIYNQEIMEVPSTSMGIKKDDFSYASVLRGRKTLGDYFPPTYAKGPQRNN